MSPAAFPGLDPLWLATAILVLTYAALLSERVHRTVAALLGASAMVILGLLTQEQAFAGIDLNTIALLTGMMIIVAVTRRTGLFEFIAVWSAKRVRARPAGILMGLALVTAVFSAFLDNLTTVLLVVPIALLIAEKLAVSPYPFLISQILAANIGGTATLIGDPPNILIGSATGLTFLDFLTELGPAAAIILAVVLGIVHLVWGRHLVTTDERRARIMNFRETDSLTDRVLLAKALGVLALVITGFIVGEHHGIRPGTSAMAGAALLLLLAGLGRQREEKGRTVRDAFEEVEWPPLFFFMGLFVVVAGVEHAGLLDILSRELLAATGNDPAVTTYATLWLAAAASAMIDNIPFVATMIPLVEAMGPSLGAGTLEPVWWGLALGACLGGNGSLIGAAANVMVAGMGDRAGCPIGFGRFLLVGLPLTLLSLLIANAYLFLRHFA